MKILFGPKMSRQEKILAISLLEKYGLGTKDNPLNLNDIEEVETTPRRRQKNKNN